jgi:uncharacterized membrane protein YqjE
MGLETEQHMEQRPASLMGRLVESMSRLVSQHLALARLELVENTQALGADVARLTAFVPFMLVGYLFLCAALAAELGQWLGWAASLLVVGVANLLVGGVGLALTVRRLKSHQLMQGTSQELQRSVAVLAAVRAEQEALAREVRHGS